MEHGDRQFEEAMIEAVWAKGQEVPCRNPTVWRKDARGAWMKRNDYGRHDTGFGWEIGFITPTEEGGTEAFDNLQPLYWRNHRPPKDK